MSLHRSIIIGMAALSLVTGEVLAGEMPQKSVKTQATVGAQVAEQAKVDINKATAKELSKVKGLSNAKAKSIVNYRKKHGDFKDLAALKDIRGFKKMNEQTLREIQNQLKVS